MKDLRRATETALAKEAYDPALQPQVAPLVKRMQEWENNNVTLEGLEVLRKMTRPSLAAKEAETQAKGAIVRNQIDNFVNNLENNPKHVLMGDAAQGAEALNRARALAHQEFKANDVEAALEAAKNKALRQGSGGNIDNAMRQELDKLNKRKSWTPDEREALRSAVQDTPRAVRALAKLSPESSGLMAGLHMGSAPAWVSALDPGLGTLVAASAPAVGFVAKRASDALTRGRAETLGDIIRAGGSRAATLPPPNMLQRLSKSQREALARALATGGALQAY
jgi:hypothetical protein